MSNHSIPPGPPYWAPSNYSQQWASSHLASSGSMPHNLPFNPNTSSVPQDYHNYENYYANVNLPGLGGPGATGSLPPPPFAFPGAFPPAATPQFSAMPNMGYPLMPVAPAPPHPQPAQSSTNDLAQSNARDSGPTNTTSSRQDLDREEGELTDIEGAAKTKSAEGGPHFGSSARHAPSETINSQKSHIPRKARDYRGKRMEQTQSKGPNGVGPKNARHTAMAFTDQRASLSSEREEGEASPESRHSSRASGSPYNPPMLMSAGLPSASKYSPRASKASGKSIVSTVIPLAASTESQTSSDYGRSLVQLRVQAQGALLSLAPHSIRYSELVGEGINPLILKQLYEEVGIRVPTTPPPEADAEASSQERASSVIGPPVADRQVKQPTQQLEPKLHATQKSTPMEISTALQQCTQANTAKPMERKEVIARMLAAKAAKSSPASVQPQIDAAQSASTAQSPAATVDKSTASTPSHDVASKEKESRVKEKNKAQTELARRRIEQLKKQGLMRSQQKSQPDSQFSDKEQQNTVQESGQAPNPTIVQHPLPERPPDPESASLARIPGLFMTDQVSEASNDVHVTHVQGPVLESTPQPRTNQRKRPRASDFDEPIPVPKRTFSNGTNHVYPERLVIDISDDEFYGDDEDVRLAAETTSRGHAKGQGILAAEGLLQTFPPPIESLPHRPAMSQSYSLSASSTPHNSRNSEHEDLRKKDLEIQAMHRRIAELEQRKKARLASRTQSPRNSDVSLPEHVSMPSMALSTVPDITDRDIESILPPLDVENLRKMKSNILRMQEIEAGVPSLDAEIRKSESRLADLRKEEENLSSELARGEEGRRQLLEELNSLKSELNGLSLDQLNAALLRLETREELPVEVIQAPGCEKTTPDEAVSVLPEPSKTDIQVSENTTSAQGFTSTAQESPSAEASSNVPNHVENTSALNALDEEPLDTSMSESEDSSSSMDESTGSTGSRAASLDHEMPDSQGPVTDSIAPVGYMINTASENPNALDAEDESLSEHPPTNPQPQSAIILDDGENRVAEAEDRLSRESPISETYEPPEPEESSSPADSSYSPSPSSDSPGPLTTMDVSGPPEDQSKEAGEPLTGNVQELDLQQPSQSPRIDLLDNARRPEDSQRNYSPYDSPLKLFKSYRYHPNYSDNVPGGLRSLTYSHNIDSLKYVCPFETAGGVCNDRSCEYQHFRDMTLSDDKILVQLGSVREGKTPEDSDKFIAGLKESINEMRRDKVKDFDPVAAEIIAYRRRFLQDPSRVLAL